MPNTPQWPSLLRNEIDSVNPVVSKLSNEMANFDKRVAALDNSTSRYLSTLGSLTRSFAGINIVTQPLFKNYEGYLNTIDKLSRQTLAYGQNLNILESRISKLSKATNLSKIEISELNKIAEGGILGRRNYSQIDGLIQRINNFAASAEQARAVFSDLVQIQGRFGNQLGSLRGLGAAELSSLSRDQFMSAIQTQFMGGGKADTKQRAQIREQQRFRQDYENKILRQGETLLPTGQALGRGAQRVGGIFGENQEGLIGASAGMTVAGGIGSLAAAAIRPWAYWDLRKRIQGQGTSNIPSQVPGAGSLLSSTLSARYGGATPVWIVGSGARGFASPLIPGTGGGGSTGGGGGATAVIPGSGPMSMRGKIGFGIGALATLAAGTAAYHYAPEIDKRLKGEGYIQGVLQGGLQGAGTGAGIGSAGFLTGNPIIGGITTIGGAIIGGARGAYKGYKGVEEKNEQVVQSEKLLGLEKQIQDELLKTQVNEEKVTALMKEFNSLVEDTSKHYNINVSILGNIYDRVQAIMKFQERSVTLVDQLSSAYGQISSTYETQLLVGSKAEEFSRKQIKTSLERVRIERAGYEEQLRLNEELNSRIASGDMTALKAQQDLQREFEKTHGFEIASLEAKAKLTTFYSQERDLQAKNLALATKTADVQGQVQNVFTQQAEQVERLSKATRIGMHASYASTLNVAQAMTQELKIQEKGYVDIASDILRINTEMNKLRESGINSVEKKERLQGLMEDKYRQELRLIEQQNKMLGTQSGIMEKLLAIKISYIQALPEITVGGGIQFEAAFDVTQQQGGPLFMAPNMFVGGSMGGGMRYAGYGVNPSGGMGGSGMPAPWAYGGFGPGTQQFGNAASRPIPSAAAQRAFGGYSMNFDSGGRVPDSDGGMLAILHSNDKAVITDQQAQRLGLTDEVLANVGKVPGFSGSGNGIPSFKNGVYDLTHGFKEAYYDLIEIGGQEASLLETVLGLGIGTASMAGMPFGVGPSGRRKKEEERRKESAYQQHEKQVRKQMLVSKAMEDPFVKIRLNAMKPSSWGGLVKDSYTVNQFNREVEKFKNLSNLKPRAIGDVARKEYLGKVGKALGGDREEFFNLDERTRNHVATMMGGFKSPLQINPFQEIGMMNGYGIDNTTAGYSAWRTMMHQQQQAQPTVHVTLDDSGSLRAVVGSNKSFVGYYDGSNYVALPGSSGSRNESGL